MSTAEAGDRGGRPGDAPLRELNQRLHDARRRARRWRVVNPEGAHAVAVGLDAELEVEIDGHVGYYCAGMNKLATVRVAGQRRRRAWPRTSCRGR